VLVGVLFLLGDAVGVGEFLAQRLGWTSAVSVAVGVAVVALIAFDLANYDLLAAGHVVLGAGVNLLRAVGHLMVVALLLAVGRLELAGAIVAWSVAQFLAATYLGRRLVGAVAIWRPTPPAADPTADPTADPPVVDGDVRRNWRAASPSLRRLALTSLRYGWVGQISALLYLLVLRADQVLLEWLRGSAAVGIYSVAVWAGEMLWLLPSALTPLLVHSSADRSDPQARDATAARAVRLGLGMTLVAAVPAAAAASLVFPHLADGGFARSTPALWALLPGIIAYAPGAVLAGDFIGRGRPGWNAAASVLTVTVNLAICMVLIPRFGAVGAAVASSIAYAVGSGFMLSRFRAVTGLAWREFLVPRPSDLRR